MISASKFLMDLDPAERDGYRDASTWWRHPEPEFGTVLARSLKANQQYTSRLEAALGHLAHFARSSVRAAAELAELTVKTRKAIDRQQNRVVKRAGQRTQRTASRASFVNAGLSESPLANDTL